MNGAVLAVDFILRSLERLGTAKKLILGKNLAILSSGEAVYFPTGQMPSKDHKCFEHIKDMSRSQWSNRHAIHETLLAGCALSPPGRLEAAIIPPTFCGAEELGGSFCWAAAGSGSQLPPICLLWCLNLTFAKQFSNLPCTRTTLISGCRPSGRSRGTVSQTIAFRPLCDVRGLRVPKAYGRRRLQGRTGLRSKNGVQPETFPLTCQANSTDVRAAAEAAMKAAAGVQQVPAAVVEAHCAHSAFVGQKHYWAHGSKKLHVIYDSVMPGAWCLGRSESGTYTLHQNHFAMCSSSTFVFWNRPLASCTIYDLWTFTFSNVFTSYALKRRISDKLCMSKNQY